MGDLFAVKKGAGNRQHHALFSVIYLWFPCVVFAVFPSAVVLAAAPVAPSNLTATVASSKQINLSWTDNATTESNYYVERSPNGSSSWTAVATRGANVRSYQWLGAPRSSQVPCASRSRSCPHAWETGSISVCSLTIEPLLFVYTPPWFDWNEVLIWYLFHDISQNYRARMLKTYLQMNVTKCFEQTHFVWYHATLAQYHPHEMIKRPYEMFGKSY